MLIFSKLPLVLSKQNSHMHEFMYFISLLSGEITDLSLRDSNISLPYCWYKCNGEYVVTS